MVFTGNACSGTRQHDALRAPRGRQGTRHGSRGDNSVSSAVTTPDPPSREHILRSMTSSVRPISTTARRISRPAIAGGLVLLLYLITLAPSTAMWDTSEYIAAAYIARPPASAGQSVLRPPRARLRDPSRSRRTSRCASTCSPRSAAPSRRRCGFSSPSGCWSSWFSAALAADRWRVARGTDRRHRVHRLESVGRQREGVHGVAGRRRDHLVAHGALVRRSRRPEGRPAAHSHRVPARSRLRQPHGRDFSRRPRSGWRSSIRRPATLLRWKLILACRRGDRDRHDAVRHAADPRGVLPGDQRRRAHRLSTRARGRLHVQQGDVGRLHVQLQSRAVRQATGDRASGAVRGAGRDVVAVLQVAVAARPVRRASGGAGRAGGALPGARTVRRMGALEARPANRSGTSVH